MRIVRLCLILLAASAALAGLASAHSQVVMREGLMYCANLHRTVYNKIVARILGPTADVFGTRTLGRVYTCAGTWQLTS